jgi:hypothetical protein
MKSKYYRQSLSGLFIIFYAVVVLFTPAILADTPKTIYWGNVNVFTGFPGETSYFNITLDGVPGPEYLPVNDHYEGWCVDTGHIIKPNRWYNKSRLYCSILASFNDTDIPECIRESMHWNKTNYILTQWYLPEEDKNEPYLTATYGDIQQALWHFGDDGYDYLAPHSSSPDFTVAKVEAIINDADTYGDNFVPQPGDTMAVIIDPHWLTDDYPCIHQLIVIPVTIPPDFDIPEFPLGTITAALTPLIAFSALAIKRRRQEQYIRKRV